MVRTRRAKQADPPPPPSSPSPTKPKTAAASKKSRETRSASVTTKKDHRANPRRDASQEAPPPERQTKTPKAEKIKAASQRLTAGLRTAPRRRSPRASLASSPKPAVATPSEQEEDAASPVEPVAAVSPARSASPRGRGLSPRLSTPAIASSPDSNLYGLSPSGEISRARIEEQEQQQHDMSRRASLAQPQSALKAQGTPAVETSIHALGRFKRRKRQPSVIRLVQLEVEASQQPTDSDLDMDDFNPEDESTPLHLTSTRHAAAGSSSSRKRKRDDISGEPALRSSPPVAPSNVVVISSDPSSDLSSSLSSLSSDGLLDDSGLHRAHLEEAEPEDDELMSETMAPPLSSSSEPLSPRPAAHVQEKYARQRRGRRAPDTGYLLTETLTSLLPLKRHRLHEPEHDTAESSSERASEPETSELESLETSEVPSSPPQPVPRRATRAGTARAKTTTSVAPKAKRLKAAPAAAEAPPRTMAKGAPRARAPLAERRSALNAPIQKRSGAGGGKRPAVAAAAAAHKAKRTYGGGRRSAAAEDKENDGDDTFRMEESSDSIETHGPGGVGRQSEELEQLKKKFAEVDAWEMDYESVDMGGTSSSWR